MEALQLLVAPEVPICIKRLLLSLHGALSETSALYIHRKYIQQCAKYI